MHCLLQSFSHGIYQLPDDLLPKWKEFLVFFSEFTRDDQSLRDNSPLLPDKFMPKLFASFQEMVNSTNSSFRSSTQQDAVEFLTYLLDSLHEELCRIKPREEESVESHNFSSLDKEDDGWSIVSKKKLVVDERSLTLASEAISSSSISRIFHGILR